MSSLLQNINDLMPLYQTTYPEDACLILSDRTKILRCLPGKHIDLRIPEGAPILNYTGSVTFKAMELGQVLREERGAEVVGIPYISTASPIFEDGQVIGVIAAVVSNHRVETLRNDASELAAMVEQLVATTDEVAGVSIHVSESAQEAVNLSQDIVDNMQSIEVISSFVKEISDQSNLLGLNAAIEAARSGEHGRGFAIVASEIRKMAEKSKTSVNEIKEKIEHIQIQIKRMNAVIETISADSEEHAASIQELKAVFEHIAVTAEGLNRITEIS